MPISYSIVIPVLNEQDSIPELYARLNTELKKITNSRDEFEIVFVDDGSTDQTFRLLAEIASIDSQVSVIQLRKRYGKTAALAAAFKVVTGEITLTMDGDLQHNPEDIPRFVEKIAEGYDIVCGWREKRVDNLWLRRIPSRCANWLMKRLSHVEIEDFGGGFKAYRTAILKEVPLYGGMQRFIPALASLQGARICQIAIENTPRRFGKSRYGISRVVPVFFDLLRIHFLLTYLQQPLRFFGSFGLALIGLSGVTGAGLLLDWIFGNRHLIQTHGPLVFLMGLALVSGIQLLMIGLVGEMLLWLHHQKERKEYSVAEIVSTKFSRIS
jgi:glycosyltransferase involved in cell wall biosynthesis